MLDSTQQFILKALAVTDMFRNLSQLAITATDAEIMYPHLQKLVENKKNSKIYAFFPVKLLLRAKPCLYRLNILNVSDTLTLSRTSLFY